MNSQNYSLIERLIPTSYVQQALNAKKNRENLIRSLIEHRKWPEEGWEDETIQMFLYDLSQMDINNFPGVCRVGEREARFGAGLVARRHFSFGHGIGRSGDIGEVQPRAAGSSLLVKLTNALLLDVIRFMGVKSSAGCFIVPMSTGMSLVLCLLTLRQDRPGAKFVLWPRIDNKSCFKAILTAGLQPIIVEPVQCGDELRTDVHGMENQITTLGSSNIVCILSTTSCVAPRASDSLEHIAALCSRHNLPHLVNNAYGLQSARLMHLIQEASKKGRVDAFVQCTDKNLLVPVGGAIISGFDKNLLEKISRNYAGRASISPILDVFITLLALGSNGYKDLIFERKEMFKYLKEELNKVASRHGERLLETRNNPMSIGMTLDSLNVSGDTKRLSLLGGLLYSRDVSGVRVVSGLERKELCGYHFDCWGAHSGGCSCPYLTASAGVGIRRRDVDELVHRLDETLGKLNLKPGPLSPNALDELVRRSGARGDDDQR